MKDGITEGDVAHEHRMARGNVAMIGAILDGLNAPSDLVWMTNTSSATWAEGAGHRECERATALAAEKEAAFARVVHRDPCGYCGVRADIGCRHTR